MSEKPVQKVYDVNVHGTENIVDLCIEHKVKKLVHISSTGAITETPHGTKDKRAGLRRGFKPRCGTRILQQNKGDSYAVCAACGAGKRFRRFNSLSQRNLRPR